MTATHSLEIEITFDVAAHTPLPDVAHLPGIAVCDPPEHRALDAVYLDTVDLALGRSGVALRRRTGGPDAGWHIKVSAPEGRHEYHWPLDDGSGEPEAVTVPDAVATALRDRVARQLLVPVARVRNARVAYALRDSAGGLVAEFTDDHVTAGDLRQGRETVWREWEFELGPAGPADEAGRRAFFAAVSAAAHAVGARPASSGSKVQRALGLESRSGP